MKVLIKQPIKLLRQYMVPGILGAGLLMATTPELQAAKEQFPQDKKINKILEKLHNDADYKEFYSIFLGRALPDSSEDVNTLNQLWQNLSQQDRETISWINPSISNVLAGHQIEQDEILVTTSYSAVPAVPSAAQSFDSIQDRGSNVRYSGYTRSDSPTQPVIKLQPEVERQQKKDERDPFQNKEIARIRADLFESLQYSYAIEMKRVAEIAPRSDKIPMRYGDKPDNSGFYRVIGKYDAINNRTWHSARREADQNIKNNIEALLTQFPDIENSNHELAPLVKAYREYQDAVKISEGAEKLSFEKQNALLKDKSVKRGAYEDMIHMYQDRILKEAAEEHYADQANAPDEAKTHAGTTNTQDPLSYLHGASGSSGEGGTETLPMQPMQGTPYDQYIVQEYQYYPDYPEAISDMPLSDTYPNEPYIHAYDEPNVSDVTGGYGGERQFDPVHIESKYSGGGGGSARSSGGRSGGRSSGGAAAQAASGGSHGSSGATRAAPAARAPAPSAPSSGKSGGGSSSGAAAAGGSGATASRP